MSLPCSEFQYDPEEPTDLEIALRILQLIDERHRFNHTLGQRRRPADGKEAIFGLAKNAAQTMTNPYARKMLLDKLAEQ